MGNVLMQADSERWDKNQVDENQVEDEIASLTG
jgi:hypothetical protein